jgi:hypothetical protein
VHLDLSHKARPTTGAVTEFKHYSFTFCSSKIVETFDWRYILIFKPFVLILLNFFCDQTCLAVDQPGGRQQLGGSLTPLLPKGEATDLKRDNALATNNSVRRLSLTQRFVKPVYTVLYFVRREGMF